jgi:hypothetical protein
MPATPTVFRVQFTMKTGTGWVFHVGDRIFRDGQPVLVFEWGGSPDNEVLLVSKKLDPSQLQELRSGEPTYLYGVPIEDPRSLH